ncbi:hypothetical protein A2U01_0107058, partial [Trifolium medium]|nr:hypothetical protein [Trifolium medium]
MNQQHIYSRPRALRKTPCALRHPGPRIAPRPEPIQLPE